MDVVTQIAIGLLALVFLAGVLVVRSFRRARLEQEEHQLVEDCLHNVEELLGAGDRPGRAAGAARSEPLVAVERFRPAPPRRSPRPGIGRPAA